MATCITTTHKAHVIFHKWLFYYKTTVQTPLEIGEKSPIRLDKAAHLSKKSNFFQIPQVLGGKSAPLADLDWSKDNLVYPLLAIREDCCTCGQFSQFFSETKGDESITNWINWWTIGTGRNYSLPTCYLLPLLNNFWGVLA